MCVRVCVCVCMCVCVCVLDSPHGAGVYTDLAVEVSCEEIDNLHRANGIACREGEVGRADTSVGSNRETRASNHVR